MTKHLLFALLIPLLASAQTPDDPVLTAFQAGKLAPAIQNVFELELMSRKRTYLINGVQFENGISIPDTASRGNIPCSFEIRPTPFLSKGNYQLNTSRFWSEAHGNVLIFNSGTDQFIVICYKLKGEVTLSELNRAFTGHILFTAN